MKAGRKVSSLEASPENGLGADAGEAKDDQGLVQSVVLTLNILELLSATSEALGVSEIALRLDVPKSRIFRHLKTLCAHGYAMQDSSSERYQAGISFYLAGQRVGAQSSFISASRAIVEMLAEQAGQTATLCQLCEDGMRIVEVCPSRNWVEISLKKGILLHFHSTAHGQTAVAFGDKALEQKVLAGPLPGETLETITDRDELRRKIEQIRAQGWAVAPNESLMGLNTLAAPIFGRGGQFVGSIAILGSVQHIKANPTQEQISATMLAARKISAKLQGVSHE